MIKFYLWYGFWYGVVILGAALVLCALGWIGWSVWDTLHPIDELGPPPTTVCTLSPAVGVPFLAALVTLGSATIAFILNKAFELISNSHARQRRRLDLMTALSAEIVSKIVRQRVSFSQKERQRVLNTTSLDNASGTPQASAAAQWKKAVERLLRLGGETPSGHPKSEAGKAGVRDRTNTVFEVVRSDLPQLPHSVIAPVIRYYDLDGMLDQAIDHLNSEVFQAASAGRKLKFYRSLFALANDSDAAAQEALRAIKLYLGRIGTQSPKASDPVIEFGGRTDWTKFEDREVTDAEDRSPERRAS